MIEADEHQGFAVEATPIVESRRLTPLATIMDDFCKRHGVSMELLKSAKRDRRISRLRQKLWVEMRATGASYPRIAKLFGMHHTTVLAAVRSATNDGGL